MEWLCVYVCKSSLQRWWISLLVGFTHPYNHTYSESLWWKLFKNHQKTQIQRQRQWQRQRQRQRHRKSAWNTQLMLYFWNPDDSLIPNMMIDTSPSSSCSPQSPRSPCVEKFDRVEQRHFCDTNGGCQDVNGFTPGLQFAATRTLFSLHFKKPTKFQFRHPSRDQGGTKTQIF